MSDRANAATLNLYPRKVGPGPLEYKDGRGQSYEEVLRRCSWPVSEDVPAIGQRSAQDHLPELIAHNGFRESQHYLHPTKFVAMRHSDHLSYAKSNDELGILLNVNPKNAVFDRLYLGSRAVQRPPMRSASSMLEMAADVAFQCVEPEDAVPLYTKAIEQTPYSIFAYEKRCAALAELGRYREALADAEHILNQLAGPRERGSALMRVKAIKDFMRRMNKFEPGYHQATTTLICLLRPREHRQLVQSHPSSYGRPTTAVKFGKGMTSSTSMGSILGWDTDGDGNIDMDEFRAKVATLGYKPRKKEKEVFKAAGNGEI